MNVPATRQCTRNTNAIAPGKPPRYMENAQRPTAVTHDSTTLAQVLLCQAVLAHDQPFVHWKTYHKNTYSKLYSKNPICMHATHFQVAFDTDTDLSPQVTRNTSSCKSCVKLHKQATVINVDKVAGLRLLFMFAMEKWKKAILKINIKIHCCKAVPHACRHIHVDRNKISPECCASGQS